MQRLNIPLSRHKRTTRRSRWVVWVLMLFVLAGTLFVCNTGRWWLSRSTAFENTPVGTVAAVQFLVNPNTSTQIERLLGNTPLISNRSITFSDIKEHVNGEFVWFFTEENDRIFTVKGDLFEIRDAFSGLGLSVDEVSPGAVMLSSSLPALFEGMEGIKPPFFPSIFSDYLGQISFPQEHLQSHIYLKDNKISFVLGESEENINNIKSIEGTVLAFSSSDWLKTQIHEDSTLLNNSLFSESSSFSQLFNDFGFLLRKADGLNEYIIEGELTQNIDIGVLLQTLVSTQSPDLIETTMLDGTVQQELRIAPELVSIEKVTSSGMTYLRAKVSEGTYLYALEHSDAVLVSNSESLLSLWINDDAPESEDETNNCSADELIADVDLLLSEMVFSSNDPHFALLQSLTSSISHVSLENKHGSRMLNLCLN
jgi:hypothetical protein